MVIMHGQNLNTIICNFKTYLLGGFKNRIHENGSCNQLVSAAATECNFIRSQIRARVEYVFGCFATSMGGEYTTKFGVKEIRLSGT